MKLYKEFLGLKKNSLILETNLDLSKNQNQVTSKEISSPADVENAVKAMDRTSLKSFTSDGKITGGEVVEKFRGISSWYPEPPSLNSIYKSNYNITSFTTKVKLDNELIQEINYGSKKQMSLESVGKQIGLIEQKNTPTESTGVSKKPVIKMISKEDVKGYITRVFSLKGALQGDKNPFSELKLEKGILKVGVNPRTCGEISWSLFESPFSNKDYTNKEYKSVDNKTIVNLAKERVKSGFSVGQGEKKEPLPSDMGMYDERWTDPKFKEKYFPLPKIGTKENYFNNESNLLNENFNYIDNLKNDIFNLMVEQVEKVEDELEEYTDWEIFVEVALNTVARDAFWEFITSPHTWSIEIDLWGNPKTQTTSSGVVSTDIKNKDILNNIVKSIDNKTYDKDLNSLYTDILNCSQNKNCKFLPTTMSSNNIVELLGGSDKLNETLHSIKKLWEDKFYKQPCEHLNVIGQSSPELKESVVKLIERLTQTSNTIYNWRLSDRQFCKNNVQLPIKTGIDLMGSSIRAGLTGSMVSSTETVFDQYLGKVTLNYKFDCKSRCSMIESSVTSKEIGLRQFLAQEDFRSMKKELESQNPDVNWHGIIGIASLLTMFIPGGIFVRLASGLALDLIDASIYLSEGNKTAAGLTVALGLLPEVVGASVKGGTKLAGMGLDKLLGNNEKLIIRELLDSGAADDLIKAVKKGGTLTPKQISQLNAISAAEPVFKKYLSTKTSQMVSKLVPTDPKVINNIRKQFSKDFKTKFGRKMTNKDSQDLITYLNSYIKVNKPYEIAGKTAELLTGFSILGTELLGIGGGSEQIFRRMVLDQLPAKAIQAGWDWTSLKVAFYNEHLPFDSYDKDNKLISGKENVKFYTIKKDSKGNEIFTLKPQVVIDEWNKGWRPKTDVGGYGLMNAYDIEFYNLGKEYGETLGSSSEVSNN